MENIQALLSITGTAVGLLVTTVTFLYKFITNAKAKKAAENVINICEAIIPYIEQAETYTAYSGAEKKEYVMTKANQFAIKNKIRFNETAVSQKIEEFIALTKQVNTKIQ